MEFKNKELEKIHNTYKTKSNKDLSNLLITLKNDFERVKGLLLLLSDSLGEVELTYDLIYSELQKRLKFKDGE